MKDLCQKWKVKLIGCHEPGLLGIWKSLTWGVIWNSPTDWAHWPRPHILRQIYATLDALQITVCWATLCSSLYVKSFTWSSLGLGRREACVMTPAKFGRLTLYTKVDDRVYGTDRLACSKSSSPRGMQDILIIILYYAKWQYIHINHIQQ